MHEVKEQSKSRGDESATLQARHLESHEGSQLPVFADLANMFSEGQLSDAFDGAQTENPFEVNVIDKIQVARTAIEYQPKHNQVSDMDSVKALMQNFLEVIGPQNEHSSYLGGLLSQWLDIWQSDRTHALLIYVLGDGSEQCSEQYRNRKLDFNNLETVDKVKIEVFKQQCFQQDVCLHLAKMMSAVNTDPDDALEMEIAISLNEIRDLNGGLLVNKSITMGRDSVIQKNLLKERHHRAVSCRKAYPGPTEGSPTLLTNTATITQDWVLVLMPEGYRFKFLTDNADPQALHDWIQIQLADLQPSQVDPAGSDTDTRLGSAGTDTNVHWGLALACKTQLNNLAILFANDLNGVDPDQYKRQINMLEAVVCASLKLRNPDVFERAVTWNPRILPLTNWEEIGSMMELADFLSYRPSLNQALTKIDSFQDRYLILLSVREGCKAQEPQEHIEMVDDWFQDQIDQALDDIQRVEENDGAVLVTVAKKFATSIDIRRIVSFAKRHSSHHNFAIEFAFSLYDDLVANAIDAGRAKYLLAEILSVAVPALCVRSPHSWSLDPWFPSRALYTSAHDRQMLQADRMARLVRCCLTVGLYHEENALLRHIWLDATIADVPIIQHVFLPYLQQLLVVMRDYSIPLTAPGYQWQFQEIISRFIALYIGREPTPLSSDLTCPPLGCATLTKPYGCPICLQLDAFLVDPRRKSADITGGIDAPEHVAAQIQGTDYLQMAVTSHSAEQMESTIQISKNVIKTEEPDVRHDLWKERVVKANGLIQAICGDEEWKLLLGDRYDECMGLKAVRTG